MWEIKAVVRGQKRAFVYELADEDVPLEGDARVLTQAKLQEIKEKAASEAGVSPEGVRCSQMTRGQEVWSPFLKVPANECTFYELPNAHAYVSILRDLLSNAPLPGEGSSSSGSPAQRASRLSRPTSLHPVFGGGEGGPSRVLSLNPFVTPVDFALEGGGDGGPSAYMCSGHPALVAHEAGTVDGMGVLLGQAVIGPSRRSGRRGASASLGKDVISAFLAELKETVKAAGEDLGRLVRSLGPQEEGEGRTAAFERRACRTLDEHSSLLENRVRARLDALLPGCECFTCFVLADSLDAERGHSGSLKDLARVHAGSGSDGGVFIFYRGPVLLTGIRGGGGSLRSTDVVACLLDSRLSGEQQPCDAQDLERQLGASALPAMEGCSTRTLRMPATGGPETTCVTLLGAGSDEADHTRGRSEAVRERMLGRLRRMCQQQQDVESASALTPDVLASTVALALGEDHMTPADQAGGRRLGSLSEPDEAPEAPEAPSGSGRSLVKLAHLDDMLGRSRADAMTRRCLRAANRSGSVKDSVGYMALTPHIVISTVQGLRLPLGPRCFHRGRSRSPSPDSSSNSEPEPETLGCKERRRRCKGAKGKGRHSRQKDVSSSSSSSDSSSSSSSEDEIKRRPKRKDKRRSRRSRPLSSSSSSSSSRSSSEEEEMKCRTSTRKGRKRRPVSSSSSSSSSSESESELVKSRKKKRSAKPRR